MESSIIAALSSSTKHMILIGDHVQLRPKVNEYKIATQHGLEISLFERLIRMGCPYVRLTTQRRMHPEVCELITPSIYKTLSNDPSVSLYPKVSGIGHRVVFIAHEELEDGQNLLSSKSGTSPIRSLGRALFLRLNSITISLLLKGIGRMISPLAAAGEVDKTKTNSHEVSSLPIHRSR